MSGYREEMTRHTKSQKPQFDEMKQAQEQTWQGCWNYQTRNFKATKINMLALLNKVESMQVGMDKVKQRNRNSKK